MDANLFALDKLPIGEKGKIKFLLAKGYERRRLLDLGFVSGTIVEAIQKSPFGDPVAYLIRGTVIALRNEDANKIILNKL